MITVPIYGYLYIGTVRRYLFVSSSSLQVLFFLFQRSQGEEGRQKEKEAKKEEKQVDIFFIFPSSCCSITSKLLVRLIESSFHHLDVATGIYENL
jgi:hypothetical protein